MVNSGRVRKLIPLKQAISDFKISQATLFRWLSEGRLTRYRQPGKGNVTYLNPAELRRATEPQAVKRGSRASVSRRFK